jgi:DNA adenine methylase
VVTELLQENRLKDVDYVEPYAGGAAVALDLLFGELAATVHINDLSRPVYAFWHTVLNNTNDLCQRVRSIRLSMTEWRRQRAVYDNRETADLADLGFAAFFLNRTNRSGIINGGVIGGHDQSGDWGIDARFNKPELIHRIRRIGRYRSRITLYQRDALDFAKSIMPTLGKNTFGFFDPPYIDNGEDLYLNTYDVAGHRRLSEQIIALDRPWIVTYDGGAIREGLYPAQRRIVYSLSYAAQDRYRGKEVMFLSDDLRVPADWQKGRFALCYKTRRREPIYAKMENVKPHPEIAEGPAAFERFRQAVKTIVGVPKSAVAARPKAKPRKRRTRRKA